LEFEDLSGKLDETSLTFQQLITLDGNEYDNWDAIDAVRRESQRLVPIVVISEAGGWREFTQTVDISESGLRFNLHTPSHKDCIASIGQPGKVDRLGVSKTLVMKDTRGIVRYCEQRQVQPSLVGFELAPSAEQPSTEFALQSSEIQSNFPCNMNEAGQATFLKSKWLNNPSRNFGSNHVDFGGMIPFASAIAINH
jgi:hypothetical protein